jgi:hypothetical protein
MLNRVKLLRLVHGEIEMAQREITGKEIFDFEPDVLVYEDYTLVRYLKTNRWAKVTWDAPFPVIRPLPEDPYYWGKMIIAARDMTKPEILAAVNGLTAGPIRGEYIGD